MPDMIIGKIKRISPVADDKKLDKAQQGVGIAVAGIVFILDDLLHSTPGACIQCFELDLHDGHAVDEQDYIISVVAVGGIYPKLVDYFKIIFAPLFNIDKGVLQRCTIFPLKCIAFAQQFGSSENIRKNDFIPQSGELGVAEVNPVEAVEFVSEVLFQRSLIPDIRAVGVLEVGQLFDQQSFDFTFLCHVVICPLTIQVPV